MLWRWRRCWRGAPRRARAEAGARDTAAVVSLLNLTGAVTAPVKDAVPDTTAIDTAQYTGTVAWHYAGGAAFTGNTFAGVAANSFTRAGAASVTNAADSGTVTITFPATAAVVSLLDLTGAVPAPERDAVPDTAAIDTDEYTGTVEWKDSADAAFGGSAFAASTVYKALVTLTAKDGFTFAGVAANSFTHSGAESVTSAADSGTVTITFPATAAEPVIITAASLASYLAELPANTADSPHTVLLAAGTNITSGRAAITSAVQSSGRYVVLDLSECTAPGNTVTGARNPSGNNFNIIKDNEYIKGVILPSTLTSVGTYAFYKCTSLTSVTLPASLTSIMDRSFEYCSSLTSVTIPDSVTSIGELAFSDCTSLTSVTIPNGVTRIEQHTFSYCSSLTSVTIPASVTTIGDGAFHACDSLTSVTFAGSAAVLNEYNRSFPSNASLLSAGGATAGGAPMQAGTYTLSGGVWTKSGS